MHFLKSAETLTNSPIERIKSKKQTAFYQIPEACFFICMKYNFGAYFFGV